MNPTIRTVIAVRHGTRNGSDLTPGGIWEMNQLVELIRERIGTDRKIKILHSRTDRGTQSAQILADALQAPMEGHNAFEEDRHRDGPLMVDMLNSMAGDADTVIVVTHFEAPSGIVSEISKRLGQKGYPSVEARYGQGFSIEIPDGTIAYIARNH